MVAVTEEEAAALEAVQVYSPACLPRMSVKTRLVKNCECVSVSTGSLGSGRPSFSQRRLMGRSPLRREHERENRMPSTRPAGNFSSASTGGSGGGGRG